MPADTSLPTDVKLQLQIHSRLASSAYGDNPPTSLCPSFPTLTSREKGDGKNLPLVKPTNVLEDDPNTGRLRTVIDVTDKGHVFISVRGTNPKKWDDIIADLTATQLDVEISHLKFKVHSGFWNKTETVRKALEEKLPKIDVNGKPISKETTTISLAGHSLGGAVVTILAMHLASQGYKLTAVCTFGSPRVGDKSFVDAYNKLVGAPGGATTYRVVNLGDPVTSVPPQHIPILNLDYLHVNDANPICLVAAELVRALAADPNLKFDPFNLSRHYITAYIAVIDQQQTIVHMLHAAPLGVVAPKFTGLNSDLAQRFNDQYEKDYAAAIEKQLRLAAPERKVAAAPVPLASEGGPSPSAAAAPHQPAAAHTAPSSSA